jgi:hypothetical protein
MNFGGKAPIARVRMNVEAGLKRERGAAALSRGHDYAFRGRPCARTDRKYVDGACLAGQCGEDVGKTVRAMNHNNCAS